MDWKETNIVQVKQYADTEDLYIEIPGQLLEQLRWKEGDEIFWDPQKDGTIKIQKANSKEDYYNSESEGKEFDEEFWEEYNYQSKGEECKDFDEKYDQYIQSTNEETFQDYFYSPEANGTWNHKENNFGFH
jgi:hypothetical protein